jgi:hypothetical protein
MRERAQAVLTPVWGDRPWEVTECSDSHGCQWRAGCPCIVYQGVYVADHEFQALPIEYIADAESAGLAEHIAGWGPRVALAVAGWLDAVADRAEQPGALVLHSLSPGPLAVARAYLRRGDGG